MWSLMAHIDSSRPVSGRHCAPQRPDLLDTLMRSCHQVILSDFFFFLDARKLNVLNVCRSGFFFFCSVPVQRMLTRMRMLEWASSARKVESLLQQNHMISSYKWVLEPQIEFILVKKVSAQKAHFNFIPVKFNKNVTVWFKRVHRFFEREESKSVSLHWNQEKCHKILQVGKNQSWGIR